MRYPFGQAARDVVTGGLKTFARAGEGRAASAPALWTGSRNAVGGEATETSGTVGRGVSKVLGRITRSPGRVFGKDGEANAEERSEITKCAQLVLRICCYLLSVRRRVVD